MGWSTGLEPAASRFTAWCSCRLSYDHRAPGRRLPLYKSGALSTELRGRVTTAVPVGRDIEPLRLEHPTNPGHLVTVTVGVLEAGGGHDKPDDVVEWAKALWLCGKGRLSYRRSAD